MDFAEPEELSFLCPPQLFLTDLSTRREDEWQDEGVAESPSKRNFISRLPTPADVGFCLADSTIQTKHLRNTSANIKATVDKDTTCYHRGGISRSRQSPPGAARAIPFHLPRVRKAIIEVQKQIEASREALYCVQRQMLAVSKPDCDMHLEDRDLPHPIETSIDDFILNLAEAQIQRQAKLQREGFPQPTRVSQYRLGNCGTCYDQPSVADVCNGPPLDSFDSCLPQEIEKHGFKLPPNRRASPLSTHPQTLENNEKPGSTSNASKALSTTTYNAPNVNASSGHMASALALGLQDFSAYASTTARLRKTDRTSDALFHTLDRAPSNPRPPSGAPLRLCAPAHRVSTTRRYTDASLPRRRRSSWNSPPPSIPSSIASLSSCVCDASNPTQRSQTSPELHSDIALSEFPHTTENLDSASPALQQAVAPSSSAAGNPDAIPPERFLFSSSYSFSSDANGNRSEAASVLQSQAVVLKKTSPRKPEVPQPFSAACTLVTAGSDEESTAAVIFSRPQNRHPHFVIPLPLFPTTLSLLKCFMMQSPSVFKNSYASLMHPQMFQWLTTHPQWPQIHHGLAIRALDNNVNRGCQTRTPSRFLLYATACLPFPAPLTLPLSKKLLERRVFLDLNSSRSTNSTQQHSPLRSTTFLSWPTTSTRSHLFPRFSSINTPQPLYSRESPTPDPQAVLVQTNPSAFSNPTTTITTNINTAASFHGSACRGSKNVFFCNRLKNLSHNFESSIVLRKNSACHEVATGPANLVESLPQSPEHLSAAQNSSLSNPPVMPKQQSRTFIGSPTSKQWECTPPILSNPSADCQPQTAKVPRTPRTLFYPPLSLLDSPSSCTSSTASQPSPLNGDNDACYPPILRSTNDNTLLPSTVAPVSISTPNKENTSDAEDDNPHHAGIYRPRHRQKWNAADVSLTHRVYSEIHGNADFAAQAFPSETESRSSMYKPTTIVTEAFKKGLDAISEPSRRGYSLVRLGASRPPSTTTTSPLLFSGNTNQPQRLHKTPRITDAVEPKARTFVILSPSAATDLTSIVDVECGSIVRVLSQLIAIAERRTRQGCFVFHVSDDHRVFGLLAQLNKVEKSSRLLPNGFTWNLASVYFESFFDGHPVPTNVSVSSLTLLDCVLVLRSKPKAPTRPNLMLPTNVTEPFRPSSNCFQRPPLNVFIFDEYSTSFAVSYRCGVAVIEVDAGVLVPQLSQRYLSCHLVVDGRRVYHYLDAELFNAEPVPSDTSPWTGIDPTWSVSSPRRTGEDSNAGAHSHSPCISPVTPLLRNTEQDELSKQFEDARLFRIQFYQSRRSPSQRHTHLQSPASPFLSPILSCSTADIRHTNRTTERCTKSESKINEKEAPASLTPSSLPATTLSSPFFGLPLCQLKPCACVSQNTLPSSPSPSSHCRTSTTPWTEPLPVNSEPLVHSCSTLYNEESPSAHSDLIPLELAVTDIVRVSLDPVKVKQLRITFLHSKIQTPAKDKGLPLVLSPTVHNPNQEPRAAEVTLIYLTDSPHTCAELCARLRYLIMNATARITAIVRVKSMSGNPHISFDVFIHPYSSIHLLVVYDPCKSMSLLSVS